MSNQKKDQMTRIRNYATDYFPFRPLTLHHRMMVEAEGLIQQNWTQVAIHDEYMLRAIPGDHAFVWVVKPEGSHVLKTFCSLSERSRRVGNAEKFAVGELESFFVRLSCCIANFRGKYDPAQYNYYVVIKRDSESDGEIIQSSFEELLDLVSAQELKWADSEIQSTGKDRSRWNTQWLGIKGQPNPKR